MSSSQDRLTIDDSDESNGSMKKHNIGSSITKKIQPKAPKQPLIKTKGPEFPVEKRKYVKKLKGNQSIVLKNMPNELESLPNDIDKSVNTNKKPRKLFALDDRKYYSKNVAH